MSLLKSTYFEDKRDYMPGIYYNPTRGLISIGIDGFNFITIADKNVGATQVYDGTNDVAHCGCWFQWGNNYRFTGSMTGNKTTTQANTTGYGPNRYYSSNNWIYDSNAIYNPTNLNLWGDVTNTNEARRGPCDEGFHIPSKSDFDKIYGYLQKYGILNYSSLRDYLKMPVTSTVNEAGYPLGYSFGFYLTSHMELDSGVQRVYILNFSTRGAPSYGANNAWRICGIRPIYNGVEIPDSTRNVLYLPN